MSTPFIDIYEMFMKSITSQKYAKFLTPEQLNETLEDYLFQSCDLYFFKCEKDLNLRDEEKFEQELSEHEKRIIVMGMKLVWFESNHLYNEHLLERRLTTKDYVLYSPAKQIDTLMALRTDLEKDLKLAIKKYLWLLQISK